MDAVFRGLQGLVQLQAVEVRVHDHAEHQRRCALVADAEARRVFVAAFHGGDVGDAQEPAVGVDRYVLDQFQAVEGAVQADVGARAGGLDEAGRGHAVLLGQGFEDLFGLEAQGRQALVGKLDEDALGLFAEDVDLLHPRQGQQALAHVLGHLHQLAVGQLLGFQGVEGEVHVRVFVVEEGPDHALGQALGFVGNLLAGLVEQLLDVTRPGGVEELDLHRDEAGLGDGFHPVVEIQLLQALLQAVCHLFLHLPRGSAGPGSGDGHGLDREGGVFGAAQLAEGDGAGDQGGDDQEERDRPVADREGGEVETAHLSAPWPARALAVRECCRPRSAGGHRGRRYARRVGRRLPAPPVPAPGAPRAPAAALPCCPHL
ncbi:hypothetical protein D3C84_625040 [compost metagenome]